jgi:hypothetical protein
MNYKLLLSLHRWIFIFVGIFMVTWLLSGILMAMPPYWFGPTAHHRNPQADFRSVVISPAEAISRMEQHTGQPANVTDIRLRQINNDILYAIRLEEGGEQLVNATTGEEFVFTPELATSIIRKNFRIETPLIEVRKLESHSRDYPWGSLPVYRLDFADDGSANYFVAEQDLKIFRSSTLTRVRAAINSLHAFDPVKLISDNDWVRKGLLIVIGTIGLAGALIGVWLTLPIGRGRR